MFHFLYALERVAALLFWLPTCHGFKRTETFEAPMTIDELKQGLTLRLLLISLAITLLSLALPIALLQVYDRILPNQGIGTAWVLTAGVLVALLIEASLRFGRAWLLNRSGMKFEAWSTTEAMRRLLSASGPELRQLGRHGMEEGFSSLKRQQDYFSGQALLALYDAPFIIVFLLMIAYIGGVVALIPLVILVLAFVIVYLLGKRARSFAFEADTAAQIRAPLLLESFRAILPLKALGAESVLQRRLEAAHRDLTYAQAGRDEYLMHIQMITNFFAQGTTVLVVLFSAHFVIAGEMSSGALAACTLLAGRTMAPVGALMSFWGQLQRNDHFSDKARQLLSLGDTPEQNPATMGAQALGLTAKNIGIPGAPANLQVTIAPGELKILQERDWLRWTPWFEALAGRRDDIVSDCRFVPELEDARTVKISMVASHVRLFQGTVLENLTLFTPKSEPLAYQLAHELALHERIAQLPQGYHTRLAEHGTSGIERSTEQLIGLVRALVCEPNILILDHADAGLDLNARARLASFLARKKGALTCLITTAAPELLALQQRDAEQTVETSGGEASS